MIGCLCEMTCYWYAWESHDSWHGMNKVWVGPNPITPIVGIHGGASSYGRNSIDPPSESFWWYLNART